MASLTARRALSTTGSPTGVGPRVAGLEAGDVPAAAHRLAHERVDRLVDAAADLGDPVQALAQDPLHAALQGGRADGARAARPLELDLDDPGGDVGDTRTRSPPSACTAGRISSMMAIRAARRSPRSSSLNVAGAVRRSGRRLRSVGCGALGVHVVRPPAGPRDRPAGPAAPLPHSLPCRRPTVHRRRRRPTGTVTALRSGPGGGPSRRARGYHAVWPRYDHPSPWGPSD